MKEVIKNWKKLRQWQRIEKENGKNETKKKQQEDRRRSTKDEGRREEMQRHKRERELAIRRRGGRGGNSKGKETKPSMGRNILQEHIINNHVLVF